ncbi:MAG: LPS export ABC transporter permease LptG [Candidatus Omnitrophica bacterium]|nr:LPS export ABC transporter permease LptG [Candidatus Omnitrophota bacterium]
MRILDRYILKSVVSIFITCIFVFLFMYVVIDLLSRLDDILKQQVHYTLIIRYYLLYIPIMFVQIAPFACLLSTIYTFSKLNHTNEIIAMRASGLSIFYLAKTVLIFGLLISLFIFWLNDRIVPRSLDLTQKIKLQMGEGSKKKEKKQDAITNLSMYGLKNRLFFINRFYPDKNTMEGITILEHNEQQDITRKIVANKGIYENGFWKFLQSITYTFDQNGQMMDDPQFLEEEIMIIPETPRDFLTQRQKPELMTINQLDNYIWKLSKSGARTLIRNLKIDLYQRYTTPFISLIIILLGIPFSLGMHRKATGLSSVGFSIMLGFLYYILDAICIALGKGGALPPLISASLSHIVALGIGLYLINDLP